MATMAPRAANDLACLVHSPREIGASSAMCSPARRVGETLVSPGEEDESPLTQGVQCTLCLHAQIAADGDDAAYLLELTKSGDCPPSRAGARQECRADLDVLLPAATPFCRRAQA